jgi:murein DD-endopeptidase MepM/ murein hydrolase activator NlpD
VIGFSGNTGFTTGPHLHFEVYSATRELGRRTIPVEFNTTRRGAIQLKEGQYYGR